MDIAYTAEATSTGEGRTGHVRSSDGLLDEDVQTPKELGGAGGATNPEQLFAAGYAACFHQALTMAARKSKVAAEGSTVTAAVGIGPEGKSFGIEVRLTVQVPGVSAEQARELAEAAHQLCPYSKATRGNVDVTLDVAD